MSNILTSVMNWTVKGHVGYVHESGVTVITLGDGMGCK